MLQRRQPERLAAEGRHQAIHHAGDVRRRHLARLVGVDLRMAQVLEVEPQPVAVRRLRQPLERPRRATAEPGLVQLAHAVLHGRDVEVHEERVGRQVVQVVRLEAGDVGGDLEAGVRKLLVEPVIARRPGPAEDAVDALADQRVAVLGRQPAFALGALDQLLRARGEHVALRKQRLDARTRRVVEVVGHQERREHPVLGPVHRAERRRDDRLALRADRRHVVEVVRLHPEDAEEARHPPVLVGAADADRAVALAARALELRGAHREPPVQPAQQVADRPVGRAVHRQRPVVQRDFLAEHAGQLGKQAVLELELVGDGVLHGCSRDSPSLARQALG